MSFTSNFLEELEKKKKKKLEEGETKKSSGMLYSSRDIAPVGGTEDFVKSTQATAELISKDEFDAPTYKTAEESRTWFKSGAFEDGYQFGDITKTVTSSSKDVANNIAAGILGIGEKVVDAGAYVAGLFGNDKFKEKTKDFIAKDLYDEEKLAQELNLTGSVIDKILGISGLKKTEDPEENSVFGEKTDALAQSGGQLLGTMAMQTVGVPWFLTSGVTSFGSEAEGAFNEGASYTEAGLSSAISAGAEILTEKLFGGSGLGEKGLINLEPLTKGISSKVVKVLADLGIDMMAEGSEEVVSSVASRLGSALYEEEGLDELLLSEEAFDEYLESFIGGMALGGVANVGKAGSSIKTGTDYRTGLTANEEAVFEKVYNDRIAEAEENGEKLSNKEKAKLHDEVMNDLEKGYIDTDTIESVLGGETYKAYKDTVESEDALKKELDELRQMKSGDMNDIQSDRLKELKDMNLSDTAKRDGLKAKLTEQVSGIAKDDRLGNSYAERARRGAHFEADLSKYNEKQKAVVQKAIDSGILNNTNRTHEFVDMVAKISADKGVLFDFTNNTKLKESGFAVEGKTVNGFVTKDGVSVNIDSAKSLNSIVGHEITHVLEGTELYAELQKSVFEYARTKNDFKDRYNSLKELYKDIEGADVDAELTADLVGDYLFTDSDFINNLSTTNRNVFQKIYDEIKYLYKVATAGSKEARELEKVKRAFDKAYKESTKAQADTKYSLADSDGKTLTKEQNEYFKNSKMRDENGNLKVMYHGSQDAGFHVFDGKYSDDDISFFFVDRNDVAASYSGTSETYEAQTIRTAEDMNNFIESIGAEGYEVIEKDGKFTLLYEGDRVAASDTAKDIYKEFCWYEGVGEGDANYKVYLNLTNPLEIDAKGRPWNKIDAEFSQEVYDRYNSLTAEEKDALIDLAEWEDFRMFNSEIQEAEGNELASAYAKMGEDCNIYDLFSVAADNFSEDSMRENARRYLKTRDYAQRAKEGGYDGVIFKNIIDNGGYSNGDEGASTVAIAFSSEQIKSVANEKPTGDPDIRYSLTKDGDAPKKHGNYNVYGEDVRFTAPVAEDLTRATETAKATENTAPTQNVTEGENEALEDVMPEGFAPVTEEEANALASENLASLEDADAPEEIETEYYEAPDNTRVDNKTVNDVTKTLTEVLALDKEGANAIGEVVQRYSTGEIQGEAELFDELKSKFGENIAEYADEHTAEAKKALRGYKLYVSDTIKGDIPEYNNFRKKLFGRLFTRTREHGGIPVDTAYMELSERYPDYFPADIINPTEQFLLMAELAQHDAKIYEKYTLDDEDIQQAVDVITSEVSKAKEAALMQNAEADRRALMDEIAPILTAKKGQFEGQRTMFEEAAAETKREKPIKTVEDRLTHKLHVRYGELSHNKRLRREALESYNNKIDALQLEYANKKNKDTKVANDILRRIERLKRLRDEVDADYTKRINDNRKRVETAKAKLEEGYSEEEGRMMRSELHARKIDEIKNKFSESGLDFDNVLKNAKNLSTWSTVDNTPQRVMEKSLGYKEGQILADETVNKVAQNESEGIKWLNSITSRDGKGGLLKQLSKKYHIKPGTKESAAAQMYAEGFYTKDNGEMVTYGDAELAADFPSAETQKNIKGLAGDPRIRQFYDETLNQINESRTRNAYPEIKPLDNYFLHFRAMDDTFSRLGIPFNPNDIKAKDLPTDLNGVTADLKPGQPYFASAMHRRGDKTTYDLLGGMERYASGAKNQIYHIDDIQTLRALRNYIADTYGQANGLDNLDNLSEEEVQDRIKQVYGSHLSTFAKFLNEEANVIAGKTALIDRGLEGIIGRRGIQTLDTINRQVGSNMVGLNVSSSLTNLIVTAQAFAKTNKTAFVKGFAQTVANKVGHIFGKADSFADNPTAVRRKGADRFYRTPWQKTADAGYAFMSAVDNVATEVIVRAKYNEFIQKGMNEQQAIAEADKWASRLMGDRSLGQMPQLYNSKMLGLVTKFQLEVRNQLDSQFYDTIQETKESYEGIEDALERNAKTAAKVTATFVELAIAQHVFGQVFESIAGYNPAFDIIDVLIKALGFDDEEDSEDTVLDNVEQGFLALLEDLPYTSILTDGGRIPISSALPLGELVTGEDKYGNEKSRLETLGEIAPYYLLPTGYNQARKTIQGLSMFSEDHPVTGSYTDSGNLRFPVEDTAANRIQAGLFGQWASENARDYFDNGRSPLNEKQIQEFADVGLSIQDYWDYRDGLKGLSKQAEKVEYINGLDVSDEQKDVLKSYLFDEIGYAEENPEKYAFLESEGIGYLGYKQLDSDTQSAWSWAFNHQDKYFYLKENGVYPEDYSVYHVPMLDFDDESDKAYEWAFDNPEKATFGKVFTGGVKSYRQYASEIYDIKADKDESGKSISGSRKEKVLDYINGLDIDYGEKIILFKNEYNADDTYNYEIIDYLNGRDDISYEEMETILKELGFAVDSEGNISWD